MPPKIEMIPISKIDIVNPRDRNKKIKGMIADNIRTVGLKVPISVRKKDKSENGKEYDLVYGQGRLEILIEAGEKEIPAIVADITKEDALVMGLIENLARKNYRPLELLNTVRRLVKEGDKSPDIARKLGFSRQYSDNIVMLLEKGEDLLIRAVETGEMTITAAHLIANAGDAGNQAILQEAYDKDILRGSKLLFAKKLLETRSRNGKSIKLGGGRATPKPFSIHDAGKLFQKEVENKERIVKKANKVEDVLLLVVEGMKEVFADGKFKKMLEAEKIGTLPKRLGERMNNG